MIVIVIVIERKGVMEWGKPRITRMGTDRNFFAKGVELQSPVSRNALDLRLLATNFVRKA